MNDSAAYIRGFEHDIFISYAHVDNLVSGDRTGWVEQFHQSFENKLAARVGRLGRVRIWRDPGLDGSQLIDDTLRNRIQASALFLALNSRGYVESDYCRQEIRCFHDTARDSRFGLSIGERRRILNVLLTNLDQGQWLRQFQGATGFPFHDAGDNRDRIGEPSKPAGESFESQIRDLADATYRLLEDFRERREDTSLADTDEEAASDQYVYIADSVDSLREIRQRLIADLEQKGKVVIADVPPPYTAAEHETRVAEALAASALSVHLLNEDAGRRIDGDADTTYPTKQVELALGGSNPKLIWVHTDLRNDEIADEGHRRFIEQLESGNREGAQYDFVREAPEQLAHLVIDKLERSTSAEPEPEERSSVLIDTHLKDQKYAFELGNYLLGEGIQPFIHQETDDPEAGLRAFEEQLKRVEKLVIFYGHVSERWVESRIQTALQFVARQLVSAGTPSLEGCYVYLLPPEKRDDPTFGPSIFKIRVINNSDSIEFEPASAAALVSSMPESAEN